MVNYTKIANHTSNVIKLINDLSCDSTNDS